MTGQKPSSSTYATAATVRASSPFNNFNKNGSSSSPSPQTSTKALLHPSSFQALIDVLITRDSAPPPLRSLISPLIPQRDPQAFSRLGVKTWKEYLELAVKAGVVNIGIGERMGTEWVVLTPAYMTKAVGAAEGGGVTGSTTPKPLAAVARTPSKLATSTIAVGASTPAAASSAISAANIPSTTPRKRVLSTLLQTQATSPEAISSFTSETYTPLIALLSSLPASPSPLRYIVSSLLFLEHSEIRDQFGWKSYVSTASDLGLITLGGGIRSKEGGPETITLLAPRVPADKLPPLPTTFPAFAHHIAELFQPTIDYLNKLAPPSDPSKIAASSRSRLVYAISTADPGVFRKVGSNENSYLELARRMGVVRLGVGKTEGSEWVALRKVSPMLLLFRSFDADLLANLDSFCYLDLTGLPNRPIPNVLSRSVSSSFARSFPHSRQDRAYA
jgi:hypothetical protein